MGSVQPGPATPVSDIDVIDYIGSHTVNSSLSSAVPLARPALATHLWIQPLTQNVRIVLNESVVPTATIGFQLAAGTIYEVPVLTGSVQVIEETASASIQYQWVRRR